MNSGRTVFSQLIQHLPEKEFQKCVARHHGDSNFRGFSCWDQLLAMAFAQLTYRESLRDIESCLRALPSKLYHMGFRGKVSRSTLADANESHDWRIFADFAQDLIAIARPLYASDPMGIDLDQSCTLWTPLPSICACRCFRGRSFGSQGRRQIAHAAGFARLDSHVHPHYRRGLTTSTSSTRLSGSRSVLRDGPGLFGFQGSLSSR